jgi:hypothetical protein
MNLNDLLEKQGIDPAGVLVLRHRPTETNLRKVLPWLAAERPATFNAYQQGQGARVEKAMQGAQYVASFIGHEPKKALFVGLYKMAGFVPERRSVFIEKPQIKELMSLGMNGSAGDDSRETILWFDLELLDFHEEWKGKLIVKWPGQEVSWWRRANLNVIPVISILENSQLVEELVSWDKVNLTWDDLRILPSSWKSALKAWRGIYLIFDTNGGKSYVGSACGDNNILGRWENYAVKSDGGNQLLRGRNPSGFLYTILQRVSPDMDVAEIVKLESSWKDRLHSRFPYGLNRN